MKNLIFATIVVFSLCVCWTSSATAQEIQSSIPQIISRGMMKQYALQNVSRGYVSVSGKFLDGVSGVYDNFQRIDGETVENFLKRICSSEFALSTHRPDEEEIGIHVGLTDISGNTLFTGWNQANLTQTSTGWTIPSMHVSLDLSYFIPVSVPTELQGIDLANGVRMDIRNSDGYIIDSIDLYSWRAGEFVFPYQYAGSFGELVFSDTNGNSYYYDLQTGQFLVDEDFVVGSNSGSIENYREVQVSANTSDSWSFAKIADQYKGYKATAPIYLLEAHSNGQFTSWSYMYHVDKDGYPTVTYPDRAWLQRVGDDFETEVLSYGSRTTVNLIAGESYYLRLEFAELEIPLQPQPYIGGKG